jgi:RNA polymerase sigma-70 factor (ECF subfamily)
MPNGDEQLLETLLNRSYVRTLIRIITARTGLPIFDEDLEQEALLRLLQAVRRIGHIQYPKAFAQKVVSDTVRDFWRQQRKYSRDAEELEVATYHREMESELDQRRLHALIRRSLSRLESRTQRAIALFYFEELSTHEVGRVLHLSHSATKMTLFRGREALRRTINL